MKIFIFRIKNTWIFEESMPQKMDIHLRRDNFN